MWQCQTEANQPRSIVTFVNAESDTNIMDASDKYTIEMKHLGAAGWAFYVGQTRLAFS
jgi:hypothetical protein